MASVGSMPLQEPMTSMRMSLYTACTEQKSDAWLMRLAWLGLAFGFASGSG